MYSALKISTRLPVFAVSSAQLAICCVLNLVVVADPHCAADLPILPLQLATCCVAVTDLGGAAGLLQLYLFFGWRSQTKTITQPSHF